MEHQFRPGVSGNPAGSQKGRTHLWTYLCGYLSMTATELTLEKKRSDLTYAQRVAMKQVEQLLKKGLGGTAFLATREAWNRDEGKPTEHVVVESPEALSEQECDEIREAMTKGGK